jgi:murein DD-endopeptidase MepM/ murein hydrolase activator NlpD
VQRSRDLGRLNGLVVTGVVSGALGTVVLVGCAMHTRAAGREPAVAATVLPAVVPLGVLTLPVDGVPRADLVDGFFDGRGQRTHHALDIPAPRNTPIRAAVAGTIAALNSSRSGGTSIWQYDESGAYCYFYAHLERYAPGLRAGQAVARGQVIGFVGTSGNAPESTPHLHFAMFRLESRGRWWAGVPVNPYPLLRGDPLSVEPRDAEAVALRAP